MSGTDQGAPEGQEDGRNSHPTRDWFARAFGNPNNLPLHLTWLFTFVLAIFAICAWYEAREGTVALQQQVQAMRADQSPLMWVINHDAPRFDDQTGKIEWNVFWGNIGKGIAYNVTVTPYIKLGDEPFQLDTFAKSISDKMVYPPGGSYLWHTVASRPGVDKEYFAKLLKTDRAVGFLVEFAFTDAGGETSFTSVVCNELLGNGANARVNPGDCKKEN